VDRIVTGFPEGEDLNLGYEDALADCSEYYHLWAIEGGKAFMDELPFHKIGLNVRWVDDITPFRTLKVRILNGAHTSAVAPALLSGISTVGEAMWDPVMRAFMDKAVYEEILPTLDSPQEELTAYAQTVFRRFENPYIRHEWRAISLNSVPKFRVRVLPSILEYERRFGKPPEALTHSLSKLIELYQKTDVRDDPRVISAMRRGSVKDILSDELLWGQDISHLAPALEA
jgi:tagaturonate reductase